MQQLVQATAERLRWLISLEDSPFTLNEHYFSSKRETYLASYRDSRARPILQPPSGQPAYTHKDLRTLTSLPAEEAALSALASLGYQIKAGDLKKLLPSDEYEEELIVMAEVRAYWQVSYKVRRNFHRYAKL